MKWLWLLVLLTGACGAFNDVDTAATVGVENEALRREMTIAAREIEAFRGRVELTAQAAETHVVEVNQINLQLLATARAGVPPTPGPIVALQIGTPAFGPDVMFAQPRASTQIDRDGCAVDDGAQGLYVLGIGRVFASARAFNLPAGTQLAIEVQREGERVFRDTWTLSENINGICVWAAIDAARVRFEPGRYTAQFFVRARPVQPPAVFTIIEG